MKKIVLCFALSLVLATHAFAGSGTWGYTPGTGLTFGATTDASGNYYSNGAIVDGAAAANKATVDAGGNLHTLAASSGAITNPSSTLALPATTTAYAAGTLMCTSATVATCNTALASQTFAIANSAGGAIISRGRISINDPTASGQGWTGNTIALDLWSAAPTFQTTGDRGVFTTDFLTGSAAHLGTLNCVLGVAAGDGVYGECSPATGSAITVKLASGTSIFWTATSVGATGTVAASKTLSAALEVLN
jgi:hypothetical protein